MAKPSVFIASSSESLYFARKLQNELDPIATATIWAEGAFQAGRTAIESLQDAAAQSDFAVVIITPDDVVSARDGSASVRSNLLFELGLFVGHLGARRIVIVADPATARIPSDLAGLRFVPFRSEHPVATETTLAQAAAVIREELNKVGQRESRPIEYHSCFISYSWNDKEFAVRLYDDLQSVGVRSWLDAKNMVVGGAISDQIDRAIRIHEKVLLVLSVASIYSDWVQWEVRHAIELERERRRTVLFPLAVDSEIFKFTPGTELAELRKRYILDFSGWHQEESYQRAFKRLIRDLSISASVEAEAPR